MQTEQHNVETTTLAEKKRYAGFKVCSNPSYPVLVTCRGVPSGGSPIQYFESYIGLLVVQLFKRISYPEQNWEPEHNPLTIYMSVFVLETKC